MKRHSGLDPESHHEDFKLYEKPNRTESSSAQEFGLTEIHSFKQFFAF